VSLPNPAPLETDADGTRCGRIWGALANLGGNGVQIHDILSV
jgi:hypothetical protein